ncbi:hypothetical protein ABT116_44740, partial [Streptomyces sp. NPDC002130]|uniref:hypothetical protein n=1 Tax=Streptomyces sp. NPDC002130 TaxID=3155568 RepID=UPI00331C17DC
MTARADKTKITREDVTLLRGGQVIGVDDGVIGVVGSMPLDPTTASPHGFELLATSGTAEVLKRNGINATIVRK